MDWEAHQSCRSERWEQVRTITINAGRARIVAAPVKGICFTIEWVEREHIVRCVAELQGTRRSVGEKEETEADLQDPQKGPRGLKLIHALGRGGENGSRQNGTGIMQRLCLEIEQLTDSGEVPRVPHLEAGGVGEKKDGCVFHLVPRRPGDALTFLIPRPLHALHLVRGRKGWHNV